MRSVGAVIPLVAGIAIATLNVYHPAVPISPKTVAAPPVNHTLVLTAHDYAFSGLPTRVSAGWVTVRMINAGKELHMFASVSVPAGMTTASLLDSLLRGNSTKDLTEWGGPNAVAPGDTATVTMFLPAGKYAVGCFVDSPDGKTHFMKGNVGIIRSGRIDRQRCAASQRQDRAALHLCHRYGWCCTYEREPRDCRTQYYESHARLAGPQSAPRSHGGAGVQVVGKSVHRESGGGADRWHDGNSSR